MSCDVRRLKFRGFFAGTRLAAKERRYARVEAVFF